MELKRLLYATDREKGPKYGLLELLVGLSKAGAQECMLLSDTDRGVSDTYLQECQRYLSNYGVRVYTANQVGNLADLILKTVGEGAFSLVIADFNGHTPKAAINSAIRRLAGELTTPVLVVKEAAEISGKGDESSVFEHVVFATDWSPSAERAASFLVNFRGLIKEMDIVNVIHEKLTVGQLRALKKRLQDTRRSFSSQDMDAEFHIYAGQTAHEIMLAATDYKASAVVMGTAPSPWIKGLFSSSISQKVAAESVCPVLLVP